MEDPNNKTPNLLNYQYSRNLGRELNVFHDLPTNNSIDYDSDEQFFSNFAIQK